VALVVVLFVILVLYVNPLSNLLGAWKERNAEQARLAQVHAEHDSLEQRAGVVKDPSAAETAARKLGMVAQGERSYVIRGVGE
jgi:hypothetical protein